MITSLTLRSVATYPLEGVTIGDLKPINFIFGANGSGKTTLSNFIVKPEATEFGDCAMQWAGGEKVPVYVYNKRFRLENFAEDNIPGVFTMGEANVTQLAQVKAKKEEREGLKSLARTHRNQKETYEAQIKTELERFTDQLWELYYKPNKENFAPAFKGAATKAGFRDRLLLEAKTNTADISSIKDLRGRAVTAFGPDPSPLAFLPQFDTTLILSIAADPIWAAPVVGKADVPIARLISKLSNSDWVNTGRAFIAEDNSCPFCQQKTVDDTFRKQLEEFFDESYVKSLRQMATLRREYEEEAQRLKGVVSAILSGEQKNTHSKLELEVFAAEVEALKSGLDAAINAMEAKLKEPSRKVEVPTLTNFCKSVIHRLEQANELISAHNTTVNSIKSEQLSLTRAVWRFLSEKSESVRDSHAKAISGLQKRLAQAIALYEETVNKGKALNEELRELTKGIAGVEASVVEINTILKSFGFNSFLVAVSKEKRGCYRIERPDGSPVGDTLSEGETTFLTFLYFYRLMVGGRNEDTVNEKRVIVVDDPISSLDSNVLFVVSSLLRAHIEDIRKNRGNIVQMFILTHNAYFQKQLSIEKGRDIPNKDTAYWVLRKRGRSTEVKPFGMANPISSTYQLLWAELRDNDKVSTTSVQNAMRRILEYYFTILGMSGNLSKLQDAFKDSPQDWILCDALIRWAHGGSHDITDEITISDSDDAKERYMQVFRKIFESNNQLGHYNMMMGITESSPLV